MKLVLKSLGCGFGKCLTYYCCFAVPTIWFWAPLFALEHYLNNKD